VRLGYFTLQNEKVVWLLFIIWMKFTIWTPWIPILWWSGVCKWHIFICLLINLLHLSIY
jgi:hypothetical protein